MATALAASEMQRLCSAYWQGDDVPLAMEISWLESRWIPSQHNPIPPDDSYGLFQINMLGQMGQERLQQFGISAREQLYDPQINVRAAHMVWEQNGNSFAGTPGWSTSYITAKANIAAGTTHGGSSGGATTPTFDLNTMTVAERIAYAAMQGPHFSSAVSKLVAAEKLANATDYQTLETLAPTLVSGDAGLTDDELKAVQDFAKYMGNLPQGSTLLDYLVNLGTGGVIPGVGQAFGSWTDGLSAFLSIITNPLFWKRIGIGVLGAGILIVALILYNKDTITGAMP